MTDYNPADHTVDEVKDHVKDNPDEAQAILDAELQAETPRVTLVKHLEELLKPVEEPEPANAQSENPTREFFGKTYEVTPDGGHRLVDGIRV